MILREIGFDMPLVNEEKKIKEYIIEKNITKEFSMKDYYIQEWREKRITFMNECEMICEVIRNMLPKILTNESWKLMVNCVAEEDYKPYCFNKGVCEISVIFDFEKYNNSCDKDKVYLQLDALQRAIDYANAVGVTDYEPILKICEELKVKRFSENVSVWRKKRVSKEYVAYIVLEHTLKNMNIYAEFKNKKGEVVYRKLLVQDATSPICYHMKLGTIEVSENDTIILYNKFKTKEYKARIPDIYKTSL